MATTTLIKRVFSLALIVVILLAMTSPILAEQQGAKAYAHLNDLTHIAVCSMLLHPDGLMINSSSNTDFSYLAPEMAFLVVPVFNAFRSFLGSSYLWSIFCGGSEYIVFPCPERMGWSGGLDGYDVFLLADPAEEVPGKNQVHTASGSPNWKGQKGDRWILGDHNRCYYAGRDKGNPDHDFVYIKNLDISHSTILLHGSPDDYVLVDTCWPFQGTAVFFKKALGEETVMDMIAHVRHFKSSELDLKGSLFDYASAPDTTPVLPQGLDQTNVGTIQMYPTLSSDQAGNVYLAHRCVGDYEGHVGPGGDIAIIKYDKDGNECWRGNYGGMWPAGTGRKFPTLPFHHINVNGFLFVIGFSWGTPDGEVANLCTTILKIDAESGEQVGFRQMGTSRLEFGPNNPTSITADDAGNLYISGSWSPTLYELITELSIFKSFLLKIRQDDLSTVWFKTTSYGNSGGYLMPMTEGHRGLRYVPDGSGIPGQGFVYQGSFETRIKDDVGETYMLGVTKWPTDGSDYIWHNVFSTPTGFGWHFMLDVDEEGYVYSAGHHQGAISTMGDPERGCGDFYVAKHDRNGKLINVRQLGTEENDELYYIVVDDERDCLFVVGTTYGDMFSANPNPKTSDCVLMKLDKDLNLLAGIQFGTAESDMAMSLTQDLDGYLYLGGVTEGSLVKSIDTGNFNSDVFLVKIDPGDLSTLE